jgi:16S rRNA (guanine527-N7)-methyltransferase
MDTTRIAELLQPFLASPSPKDAHSKETEVPEESTVLTPTQLKHISTYIDLLLRWNARINLTAIREPEEIVTRHFGESLFAALHLFPSEARTANDVLDIGSGAGFPGLPIKIWAPRLHLTLIESNQKKATFLREVIRSLTLTDINVFSARAEAFLKEDPRRRAGVVTLRAVERFDSILHVAARLVAPSGRLALLVGRTQVERATDLLPALRWQDPVPIPQSSSRVLLVGAN